MVTQSWPWGSQIAVKKMYPSKHLSWWIRLEDIFRLRLQKTSWSRRIYSPYSYVFRRRLEDVLIKTNIFALLIRLQKTPSRRFQDVLVKINIFILVIRLQDFYKTFSRRLQDVLQKRLQDNFKTFLGRLQDVLQRCLQDIFKTYHQVKMLL